jgi:hypothetical protein
LDEEVEYVLLGGAAGAGADEGGGCDEPGEYDEKDDWNNCGPEAADATAGGAEYGWGGGLEGAVGAEDGDHVDVNGFESPEGGGAAAGG